MYGDGRDRGRGASPYWPDAPVTDPGRVLLFLHGGGFEFGSVRSDGELAARIGRAAGMRVLFPEYRLAPEHSFPRRHRRRSGRLALGLRATQDLNAASLAVAATSPAGSPSPCSWPCVTTGATAGGLLSPCPRRWT